MARPSSSPSNQPKHPSPLWITFLCGFINGIHINLKRAPFKCTKAAGAWHRRKERYGWNVVAVVDEKKRFAFGHWGYSAAASDMRVQRAMRIHSDPHDFFDHQQYLLADSGFQRTNHIVPMYRQKAKEANLTGKRAYFNIRAATPCVTAKHAFGILKGRWQILCYGQLVFGTESDEAKSIGIIQTAMILHNLYVAIYHNYISKAELNELIGTGRAEQQRPGRPTGNYSDLTEQYRRRKVWWMK